MSYKIGSFNMYKMNYQANVEIKKDLEQIANIIRTESFDVVAMQEVMNANILKELLRFLSGWEFRWAYPKNSSPHSAEGYAFLWNKSRMRLVTTYVDGMKRVFEPRILNQYKVDTKKGQQKLLRNPYFGRFTPSGCSGGPFFEIRLINTHFRFSKDSMSELGQTLLRKNEFDVLTQTIYPKYADKRYGDNMPSYTIILGDYNLNLKRDWTQSPYLTERVTIEENNKITHEILTVQDKLTTLKKSNEKNNNQNKAPVEFYANNYDHFSYDAIRFRDIEAKDYRVDAVHKYYGNDAEKYVHDVSDHVPIGLDLNLLKGE